MTPTTITTDTNRPAITPCADHQDAQHRATLAAKGRASRWDSTPVAASPRASCGRSGCEARPTRGGSCLCDGTR